MARSVGNLGIHFLIKFLPSHKRLKTKISCRFADLPICRRAASANVKRRRHGRGRTNCIGATARKKGTDKEGERHSWHFALAATSLRGTNNTYSPLLEKNFLIRPSGREQDGLWRIGRSSQKCQSGRPIGTARRGRPFSRESRAVHPPSSPPNQFSERKREARTNRSIRGSREGAEMERRRRRRRIGMEYVRPLSLPHLPMRNPPPGNYPSDGQQVRAHFVGGRVEQRKSYKRAPFWK